MYYKKDGTMENDSQQIEGSKELQEADKNLHEPNHKLVELKVVEKEEDKRVLPPDLMKNLKEILYYKDSC